MVAYWLIMIVVVGGLFFAVFKMFKKMFPTIVEPTLQEKRAELEELQRQLRVLDMEVDVTEQLSDIDLHIKVLKDQLIVAESNRLSNKED